MAIVPMVRDHGRSFPAIRECGAAFTIQGEFDPMGGTEAAVFGPTGDELSRTCQRAALDPQRRLLELAPEAHLLGPRRAFGNVDLQGGLQPAPARQEPIVEVEFLV